MLLKTLIYITTIFNNINFILFYYIIDKIIKGFCFYTITTVAQLQNGPRIIQFSGSLKSNKRHEL